MEVKAAPLAMITGGTSKLGTVLATALLQQGWRIILHYYKNNMAASAFAQMAPGQIIPLQGDLSSPSGVKEFIDKVRALQEEHNLDLLINNAALYPVDTLHNAKSRQLETLLQLNTVAPLELSRALAFKEGAMIVNIGDARQQTPIKGHFSYGLSKNFLRTLTAELAQEMAPAVRVNMLALGQICFDGRLEEFEQARLATPMQRLPTGQEVAAALQFLCSASSITGQVIYLDGGRHLKGTAQVG